MGQWRVGSGRRPVWSRDGEEILYVTDDGISRVTVETDAESTAVALSRPAPLLDMPGIYSFDLSPDGQRLAIHRLPVDTAAREIRIIQTGSRNSSASCPMTRSHAVEPAPGDRA